MIMECDEIAIPKALWEAAKAENRQEHTGPCPAKEEIARMFNGMVLYVHCLVMPGAPDDYAFVTARELCTVMNDQVCLTVSFDAYAATPQMTYAKNKEIP